MPRYEIIPAALGTEIEIAGTKHKVQAWCVVCGVDADGETPKPVGLPLIVVDGCLVPPSALPGPDDDQGDADDQAPDVEPDADAGDND